VQRPAHVIAVGKPAAGGGFTVEVPGAVLWRPVALVFTQVNAAAVASRYTTVSYQQGSGVVLAVNAAPVLTTTGETWRFVGSAWRTVSEWNTGTDILFPLAPILLDDECSIVVAIASANAGDQLSGITLTVEQYDLNEYVPGYGLAGAGVHA
jgi:hypothetical protein